MVTCRTIAITSPAVLRCRLRLVQPDQSVNLDQPSRTGNRFHHQHQRRQGQSVVRAEPAHDAGGTGRELAQSRFDRAHRHARRHVRQREDRRVQRARQRGDDEQGGHLHLSLHEMGCRHNVPTATHCCQPPALSWHSGPCRHQRPPKRGDATIRRVRTVLIVLLAIVSLPAPSHAQIKAQLPEAPMTPPWDKGIQPISRDSYWNAVECGKQGGARPACVFYDADLCKNDDFTLAMYTPYKSVAYEVWRVIKNGQPAPTPSYGEAQRTRVTVGVTRREGIEEHDHRPADQARRQDDRADAPARSTPPAASSRSTSRRSPRPPTSRSRSPANSARSSCTVDETVLAGFR